MSRELIDAAKEALLLIEDLITSQPFDYDSHEPPKYGKADGKRLQRAIKAEEEKPKIEAQFKQKTKEILVTTYTALYDIHLGIEPVSDIRVAMQVILDGLRELFPDISFGSKCEIKPPEGEPT